MTYLYVLATLATLGVMSCAASLGAIERHLRERAERERSIFGGEPRG